MDYWEHDARALGDERGLLEVLNEETGYFRRTGEKEKAEKAISEALALTEKLGLSGKTIEEISRYAKTGRF